MISNVYPHFVLYCFKNTVVHYTMSLWVGAIIALCIIYHQQGIVDLRKSHSTDAISSLLVKFHL